LARFRVRVMLREVVSSWAVLRLMENFRPMAKVCSSFSLVTGSVVVVVVLLLISELKVAVADEEKVVTSVTSMMCVSGLLGGREVENCRAFPLNGGLTSGLRSGLARRGNRARISFWVPGLMVPEYAPAWSSSGVVLNVDPSFRNLKLSSNEGPALTSFSCGRS